MKIVDTHSHLNFKAFDSDRDEVIKRTQKQGVICVDVGTKYETSKQAVELAEKYEGIYASIGMHPIHIGEEFDKKKYKKLAKSKKVVAIGEIGLDNKFKAEKQKQVFLQQLDLAKELDLPVIIHCRMAHTDVLDILKSQITNSKSQTNSKLRGTIHCFTGNWEQAQQYMDLGFYIGINGIIFKMDLDEVIKKTSLDKILVETDCPYLTPPQERDKRNEPIFVKHVIQKIADLKGSSFNEVADKTTQTAQNLFGI